MTTDVGDVRLRLCPCLSLCHCFGPCLYFVCLPGPYLMVMCEASVLVCLVVTMSVCLSVRCLCLCPRLPWPLSVRLRLSFISASLSVLQSLLSDVSV